MKAQVLAVAALALFSTLSTAVSARQLIRNHVPEAWRADTLHWVGDQNPANKIDDRIDAGGPGPYAIFVNFKECTTDQDVAELRALALPLTNVTRLKYLASVALHGDSLGDPSKGVLRADIIAIAQRSDVAFIELQDLYVPALDVSVPDICVAPGAVGTACHDNTCNAEASGLTGNQINIAIMDTGVDDHVHNAFAGVVTYGHADVQGYDALATPPSFTNPPDGWYDPDMFAIKWGHGTFVASIALGRAWTVGSKTYRGVARQAGLIDVRCIPGTLAQACDALETIYYQKEQGRWDVHIINGSFWTPGANHDGKEVLSQLIDLASDHGILFVAAAGNGGPTNRGVSAPCAATRSLCVADYFDQGTPDRIGSLSATSSRGKRADDHDLDRIDELKPEVAAPGTDIWAASPYNPNGAVKRSGTSAAAPHVAGLAAIVMQAHPGIGPASVKALIIGTSDKRGGASDLTVDPDWNVGYGWGLVDACAVLEAVTTADLTFPHDPPPIPWLSPDIAVVPAPEVDQTSTVTATIQNRSVNSAIGVRVHFGVEEASLATPAFYDIGTRIVDISGSATRDVSIDWRPAEVGHWCMKVELAYAPESDYSNNTAQRNLSIAASSAEPDRFTVRNVLTEEPKLIELRPAFEVPSPGWRVEITPDTVTLGSGDCPAQVDILLIPPPGGPRGPAPMVNVAAVIAESGDTLGGVSVQGVNPVPSVSGRGLTILGFLLIGGGAVMRGRRRLQRK